VAGHPSVVRAVRLSPLIAAAVWLLSMVVAHGPIASDTLTCKLAFVMVIVAAGIAIASGVYEPRRRVGRRDHAPIDWDEFDRVRASWQHDEVA
jgi:hypothetical protein